MRHSPAEAAPKPSSAAADTLAHAQGTQQRASKAAQVQERKLHVSLLHARGKTVIFGGRGSEAGEVFGALLLRSLLAYIGRSALEYN